jgi:hypothetical protein
MRVEGCSRFLSTQSLLFLLSCRHRKDQKKVSKLEAQIPYHQGRGNMEEVEKIKQQVAGIWEKAREAALA